MSYGTFKPKRSFAGAYARQYMANEAKAISETDSSNQQKEPNQMRVIPISEIKQMHDGELIAAIDVTVKSIFDQNKGENSTGPWAIQNIVVKDATGDMKLALKDRDPLPKTMKGKRLVIESFFGDKGQSGLKVKDEEYPKDSGKLVRTIWVTPSAIVTTDGTAMQNAQAPATQPPVQQPATQQRQAPAQTATTPPAASQAAPAAQQAEPQTTPATQMDMARAEIVKTKAYMARMANGWALARMTVLHKAEQIKEMTKQEVPEAAIQAATASLFIASERAGHIDSLPTWSLEKLANK